LLVDELVEIMHWQDEGTKFWCCSLRTSSLGQALWLSCALSQQNIGLMKKTYFGDAREDVISQGLCHLLRPQLEYEVQAWKEGSGDVG
jgi:hypothetical protein